MNGLLNQAEIDELLNQLSREALMPSIIEIKPDEIDKINDIVERNKIKRNFEYTNELYVKPLAKLLGTYYSQKNKSSILMITNMGDFSIIERINAYRRALLPLGFTNEQLVELVPKDKEEVNLLVSAMEKGFKEEPTLNNKERLIEARNYLSSLENNDDYSEEPPKIRF